MKEKSKQYLVLGLGRFGESLASRFISRGTRCWRSIRIPSWWTPSRPT
jgi:predicted dinucleotide-binding enzyme